MIFRKHVAVRKYLVWLAIALVAWLGFAGVGAIATPEPQPNMRLALGYLRKAEYHWSAASSNKGGYRVKALRLTREAIAATKAGIDYARRT